MHRYTTEEKAFLLDAIPKMTYADAALAFYREFMVDITPSKVKAFAYRNGIKAGKHLPTCKDSIWTEECDAYFREIVPGHEETEIRDLFYDRFAIMLRREQIKSRKSYLHLKSGTFGGRFQAGEEAWNKGLPWSDWMPEESAERSLGTCFKKGEVPRSSKIRPVGYERVTPDGYVLVKVKDGIQSVPNENYEFKHRLVWEEANGQKVPDGCHIVFADHDKANLDPDNLVCVPFGIMGTINQRGIDY